MYALQDLGWTDSHTIEFEPHAAAGLVAARVAAQHRGAYVVLTELGELRAVPAGRLSHEASGIGELPAVGDWVAMTPRPEEGTAVINAV
ncbi:MAG: ribosome small subunit-dependent GTPase A, partial [Gaiellaceae bacterium]